MWIILALLGCTQLQEAASAGGTLSFLSLYSYATLSRNEQYSTAVSTGGRFRFGRTNIDSIYISKNGYFSMGEPPRHSSLDDIPGPSSYSVVAPFAANIDTSSGGSVKYKQYTSHYQMEGVSRFIRSQTVSIFYGTRMIVAEWSSVPQYGKPNNITNTFQGILITDGIASYAVFIYECGSMEWGGGVIGWQEGRLYYNSHSLSGDSNSNDIGCLYSTTYSAVVFKIDNVFCVSSEFTCYSGECSTRCDGYCFDNSDEECSCDSDEFLCDNRICISERDRCDNFDDCGDNSDEEGCVCNSNQFSCDSGGCISKYNRCDSYDDCGDNSDEEGCDSYLKYFGILGGLFSLSFIIGIPTCIGVIVCYRKRKRTYRRLQNQDHVVTATPATGGSVVTTNQTASTANPVYEQPQYPQQLQQPVDQLSSQDTSSAATAIPTQQLSQQNIPYPVENLAYPGHPPADQTYPPPTVQEPHGGTGDVKNAGILLQE